MKALKHTREKISEIDKKILDLITERMSFVHDILQKKINMADGGAVDIFDPKREAAIIQNLIEKNDTSLSSQSIENIFESIIHACRDAQIHKVHQAMPFLLSIQGTPGSYSEQAAWRYLQKKSIQGHQLLYAKNSARVVRDIRENPKCYGLVALNNAHGGLVQETIEALSNGQYLIVHSLVLTVEHALLTRPENTREDIAAIYSHPQALKQCRAYLKKNYPHAQQLSWEDTALAAHDLASGRLPDHSAIIAHERCAKMHALQIIDHHIQDLGSANETLFLLIKGKHDA